MKILTNQWTILVGMILGIMLIPYTGQPFMQTMVKMKQPFIVAFGTRSSNALMQLIFAAWRNEFNLMQPLSSYPMRGGRHYERNDYDH